ncbi:MULTISPECIES: hypothetical protein [Methylobacter]|jgi:hypothetical protein|uniref:hypothetical protein n=1 Tax=Methylobacter TaxID=429 RepID=UPI0003AABBD3|nr:MULTISPECIES: hypothetical protein [Methylobacter]
MNTKQFAIIASTMSSLVLGITALAMAADPAYPYGNGQINTGNAAYECPRTAGLIEQPTQPTVIAAGRPAEDSCPLS